MSIKALSKAKEAILFLCKRCDEQGFYSPPRQQLIVESLEQIDEEISKLIALKEQADELYVPVASMHPDTLAMNLKSNSSIDQAAAWSPSKAKYDSNYVQLFARIEDVPHIDK